MLRRFQAHRRTLELAATIASTFEPVVQTSLYPRSQIDIYVHVLQQDGSLLAACINATTLALITAGVPLGRSGSTNLIKAQIVNEEDLL